MSTKVLIEYQSNVNQECDQHLTADALENILAKSFAKIIAFLSIEEDFARNLKGSCKELLQEPLRDLSEISKIHKDP